LIPSNLGVNSLTELFQGYNNSHVKSLTSLPDKYRNSWKENHDKAFRCLVALLSSPPTQDITPDIARNIFKSSRISTLPTLVKNHWFVWHTRTQITRKPSSIPGLVTAFCETKNTTNLSPGNSNTAIKLVHNQNNAPKRYVHPITGRRLREPSSPSPTLENSNKTANDTLVNHQQQSSLQDEANKTNSRDMDTSFSGSNNKRPLYNHQTCNQNPDDTRQITRLRTSRNQCKQLNTHPEHVQLSQQPLMKNLPSHTQTVTQTHDLSLLSAEPTRGSEKQLVKKSTKPRPKKHTPTSQKELARLDSSDLASSLCNYKRIQQHNVTTQQKS